METALPEALPGARPRSSLPVLALGANAWVVAVGWPLLAGAVSDPLPWLLSLLPLLALAAGALLAGGAATRMRARDVTWWLGFPSALTAATASAYDAAGETAISTLPLALAALSLSAFGAALAVATAPASPAMAVELTPLRVAPARGKASVAPAVLSAVLFGGGALFLGVLLPALGTPAELALRWGDGARQGAVLTAVVGGALAVTVLASHWPAALRREPRDAEPRADGGLRVAWFLFLSLLGAVTYYVVQP